jgi:hypothetical protein
MDSKIMFTKHDRRVRQGAFALTEMLMVMGVSAILMLALTCFFMLSSRSFAAFFNYVDLDDANRVAMDILSRDIRQANRVTSFTTNSSGLQQLVLEDSDLTPLTFDYDPTNRTLTRIKGTESRVLLRECDSLNFDLRKRTPIGQSYEFYPPASTEIANAKIINVAWLCSRKIFGRKENTESVQTARIVIRKQGT